MTKDEFLTEVAELVAGLQVPASIAGYTLGAGYMPWKELLDEATGGLGWTTAEQCREAFAKVLE